MEPTPYHRITVTDIYTKLVEIQATMDSWNIEQIKQDMEDHEARVRSLEKKYWTSAAIFPAIAGLIGIVVFAVNLA